MSSRAPIGHLGIAGVELCTNQGCKSFVPLDGIDAVFLYFALESSVADLQRLGSGATFAEVSKSQCENYEIPLPPLPEQRRIAAVLREQMAAVERARAAARARLEAVKALPAAFLRQVFPQPAQPLPPGWRWARLGEVVLEAQPGFACGKRDPQGVVQLRMNNVGTWGNLIWDEVLRVPADPPTVERFVLMPGDVVFNNTNSTELVGKSALFTGYSEPVVYSNHFTRLRTQPEALFPQFLAAWLSHQWQRGVFAAICNRWIGQSAIKTDKLFRLEIPLPPLSEQRRIAAILTDQTAAVERARAAAEVELEAIEALPAALLRREFNGEL
jgi:type I restriction enzyme S subunit